MDLATLLLPQSRVLDVGPADPTLARALAERGFPHYLGLVAPDRLAQVRELAGEAPPAQSQPEEIRLADRFSPLQDLGQVIHNSTDLLILRGRFARVLWNPRDVSHVRYVAVEARPRRRALEAWCAVLTARLTGRLSRRGRFECAGTVVDVLEVAARPAPRPRRYLSPVWEVPGLLARLESAGLRYVALRWFEDLPDLPPGEDLDLLVADEDLAALQQLLDQEPGTIPVDLYSETGMPGADYQGVAYYPPALARQVLDRAVVHSSGCRVPDPADHLHSLAYHALYHKGARSGLASALVDRVVDPENDYEKALQRLAADVGVDLTPALEEVDDYLGQVGWRPPPDTLRRLAAGNDWVARRFLGRQAEGARPDDDPTPESDPGGLPEPAVFLVRERTLTVLALDEVLGVLRDLGFELVAVHELTAADRSRTAGLTRGGNWGRGPFPVGGGDPAVVVVAVHYGPRVPPPSVLARYPRLTNGDVLDAKLRLRDLVAERAGQDEQFNAVHSSDDEPEAWEYVEVALPQDADALRAEVDRRRAEYRTGLPVARTLSLGRRAKVEVVQTDEGVVVRKTFAPRGLRHLARELEAAAALADLGNPAGGVVTVLDSGPNWFTMPYVENRLTGLGDRPGGQLVPLAVARQMVEVLRAVHAAGADLVDAKPQNFLLGPSGLVLVDLEFFHRYPGAPPPFEQSYAFIGLPPEYDGDEPVGELSYEVRWLPYIGLSLSALLNAPRWNQHLRRTGFRLRRALIGPDGPARRTARWGRDGVRAVRRGLGARYRGWARRRARVAAP